MCIYVLTCVFCGTEHMTHVCHVIHSKRRHIIHHVHLCILCVHICILCVHIAIDAQAQDTCIHIDRKKPPRGGGVLSINM